MRLQIDLWFDPALDDFHQMMGTKGHPDLVSGPTDEWWRMVRKGVSVAFSPANIRCATQALGCDSYPQLRAETSCSLCRQWHFKTHAAGMTEHFDPLRSADSPHWLIPSVASAMCG